MTDAVYMICYIPADRSNTPDHNQMLQDRNPSHYNFKVIILTHIHTTGKMNSLMLQQVVHIITTVL